MGLVLLQASATGYVTYDFCSELAWAPCSSALAPKLTLRYHLIPPAPSKAVFQQGTDYYTGNRATYFDGSGGNNNSSLLRVGADNWIKSLLRFDLSAIPSDARIDEATLRLFQTARSNGNSLTIGAHRVLAEWVDSEANRTQRRNGINWNAVGMGSGSDYEAGANGSAALASAGGAWIDLNVTAMAQDWVTNPSANFGLTLTQEAASGYVYYSFCSELGYAPCNATQAPRLTIWYH